MNDAEALRAEFESRLMATAGVVGVGSGVGASGQARLKVYASVPPEQLRAQLPTGLDPDSVDIEYVGQIEAQSELGRGEADIG
jgi:hypothetical protein